MDPMFEVRMIVDHLYETLQTAPYHEFLGVGPEATGDELRVAFHQRARKFHPDRYHGQDGEFRTRVYEVYKRMTEAYQVLSDPPTRQRYERQQAAGANRYDPGQESQKKRAPGELDIKNARAKKYHELAMDALRRGDKKSALMNLKFAAQMEPDNVDLKALVEKHR